jgi:hypothetical protein
MDWVGLFAVGAASGREQLDWQYLNGTKSPPAAGLASATLTFPFQAGNYEFRLYANNSNSNLLASAPVPSNLPAPSVVSDGMIHVDDPAFGCKGSPVGDDTVGLQAAAAAAKASASGWGSKGIYIPPGFVCVATQPIDFRGIQHVDCRGWLTYGAALTAPGFRFGFGSNNQGGKFEFNAIGALSAAGSYATQRHPVIQFSGCRGAYVRIGVCSNFVEVYGDCDDPYYASTAWSEFHMGQTWRLELRDNASNRSAWINTNQFYGGALAQLRIGGPWIDATVTGSTIQTAIPHGYASGNLVEMYNGNPGQMAHGLVTVVDATHFTFPAALTGTGWRCMGPPGYPHNDNQFHCTDIEDSPAIVHMQGIYNRLEKCRGESSGPIICGPDTYGNAVEFSNSSHGRLPAAGELGDGMALYDYSNGKNGAGWVRVPRAWGQ